VDILKGYVKLCVKYSERLPNGWILYHNNAPVHKTRSLKHFQAKNFSLKRKSHPIPLIWIRKNSRCFQKKFALKGRRFHDTEDINKSDYGTESYPAKGVPKTFPTVAASLGYMHGYSKSNSSKLTHVSKLYTGIERIVLLDFIHRLVSQKQTKLRN
jgi:hypothetical protein